MYLYCIINVNGKEFFQIPTLAPDIFSRTLVLLWLLKIKNINSENL